VDTVRLGISLVLSESELAYVALYAVSLNAGRAIFVTLRSSIHGLHIRVDSEYSLAVLKFDVLVVRSRMPVIIFIVVGVASRSCY